MKISKYAQDLLKNSTCCHTVLLRKEGENFTGIYNGLSYWGRVEDGDGEFIEELQEGMETDDNGSQYLSHFSEKSFTTEGGYEVIK